MADSKTPQNWLYGSIGDFETEIKPLVDRGDISGAQVVVPWRLLERKPGEYNFTDIDRILDYMTDRKKGLFLQIQDRFFALPARVPDYLREGQGYAGGVAPTTNESGLGLGEPGAVAAQWNDNVRARFQALLAELAKKYDGKITGINLPETAVQVDTAHDKTGYSDQRYFDATLANMAYGKSVFRKSAFVQYINFWPGEWDNNKGYMERSFEFAQSHGVGVGGPDVIPNRPAQMQNSYPFFKKNIGKLSLVSMAVQEPDFEYVNPETGKHFTRDEFVRYASEELGAHMIFWATMSPWLH